MIKKYFIFFAATFALIVAVLIVYISQITKNTTQIDPAKVLRVMAYSNFLKAWGAGKELTTEFETKYGVRIEWIEISNAGMMLENLSSRKPQDLPDVVLGLDLLSLPEARKTLAWRAIGDTGANYAGELPRGVIFKDFIPFDWAPMTFIFRRGELQAPQHLDDLLTNTYANSLALQDPNVSSTGLYFLIWILSVKGEAEGFKYLKQLKPSIRIISPSWSSSYSLFQNNQVPMVFSYFTSTIYHYVNEKDYRYQPVYFNDPHIYAVEYMSIPEACRNCEVARKFVKHLLSVESQKVIMEKNYMLPVIAGVKTDTPFDFPKSVKLISPQYYETLLAQKEEILKKWYDLHL